MKLKFDVSGSDPEKATGSNFEAPKPGVYDAKIDEIEKVKSKNSGNEMLKVTVGITGPKFKGAKVFDYIVLNEASLWKLDQFLQALGLASKRKRKGTIDTDELVGERIKVRIKNETYNDQPSAKIGAYMEPSDEDEDDLDDELDDDVEDADDEDEDEDLDDDEDLEEEDDEESEDEEPEDDYEEMSVPDLREELKQRDLNPKGAKPALIARLRADDAGEDLPD